MQRKIKIEMSSQSIILATDVTKPKYVMDRSPGTAMHTRNGHFKFTNRSCLYTLHCQMLQLLELCFSTPASQVRE